MRTSQTKPHSQKGLWLRIITRRTKSVINQAKLNAEACIPRKFITQIVILLNKVKELTVIWNKP